jgi:23S rRNA (guanine745-N1)-methyltransferase
MLFVCPICNKQLNIDGGKSAVCASGHSFDKSRKGYYNLLVGRGGAHGDNREMVLARRAFLARGFYEPLASFVAESVASLIGEGASVLDAG